MKKYLLNFFYILLFILASYSGNMSVYAQTKTQKEKNTNSTKSDSPTAPNSLPSDTSASVLGSDQSPLPKRQITLQSHRILYEISLADGKFNPDNALSGAAGLLAMEFNGNACIGYTTRSQQTIFMQDRDGGRTTLDLIAKFWEDGGGKNFRFQTKTTSNKITKKEAEGKASYDEDDALIVQLKKPNPRRDVYDPGVLFPNALLVKTIAAAQAKEKTFTTKVFEGAEVGDQIYEVVVNINSINTGISRDLVESFVKNTGPYELPYWLISMAYYENKPGDKIPVYTIHTAMLENGVVSHIRFDFPDFSLVAQAIRFEISQSPACDKNEIKSMKNQ